MKKIKSEKEVGNVEWVRGVCYQFRESLIVKLPFLFSKLKKKFIITKRLKTCILLTSMISCHLVPSTLLMQIDLKECMLPDKESDKESFLYGM